MFVPSMCGRKVTPMGLEGDSQSCAPPLVVKYIIPSERGGSLPAPSQKAH
jgi:hypothetical protein